MSSLLVIAIGFVSTIVLASLGDAATMAFGGSSIHTLSIFGLILFWVGLGARDSDRSDRALQTCAWICVGTLLLLWTAPILSAWFASPLPSFQAFLGLGFLSVLFATPLRWLGRHLCARVQAHAPRSWNQVAFGVWLALVFISLLGVGPIVFSIACAALTLLWLFPFPLPNPRILSAPHAKLIQLMPLAFIVASGTFGLLWLLPHLELFDSSTTNLDGLRITTMAIAVLVGGIMIGAPLAETNFAAIGVSILSSCLAWSWTRAAQQLDHLSDEKVFRLMVGNDGVLSFFGLQDRLTEEHWAFAPYLVLLVGMVSLGLLGGITRALFHQTLLDKKDAISAEGPISILFLASGLTLVLSAAAHPWLTEFRPIAAWVCALFAVIFCLSTCPREIPLWIRGCVGIFLLSFPVFAGTPRQPNTGHPFADNFSYKVLPLSNDKEVLYSPLSIVRIIDRNAAKRLGNRFLAKGKNFLLDNKDDGGLSVREALVACALGNPSGRFLLAGSSRPETIEALNRIGPKDLLVVSDPPELFQAISSSWDGASGTRTPPYRATIADAGAEFGLVLLQDSAIWDGGQNLLRSSQLSVAASKVKQDGVLAVVMNPDKSPIELVGAVAKQLERDLGSAVVWLIPNGWGTPSLVITGREKRVGA
ncbi:MAG: hypothetical protein QF524_03615, partial [Planctomycetota bacterium]|nr:hypothetical protein [Planctomycetota bacterium]